MHHAPNRHTALRPQNIDTQLQFPLSTCLQTLNFTKCFPNTILQQKILIIPSTFPFLNKSANHSHHFITFIGFSSPIIHFYFHFSVQLLLQLNEQCPNAHNPQRMRNPKSARAPAVRPCMPIPTSWMNCSASMSTVRLAFHPPTSAQPDWSQIRSVLMHFYKLTIPGPHGSNICSSGIRWQWRGYWCSCYGSGPCWRHLRLWLPPGKFFAFLLPILHV